MSLIDLVSKQKGPIFLKDSSEAEKQLDILKSLPPTPEIEKEIKLVESGIAGEKNIRFELETAHIPCYVLHDLYLEYNGQSAQIDYLIICRRCHYVIESKNLFGNIEIDSKGNFTRKVQYGKYVKKEGIYSPITQNQRHIDLIKQILKSEGFLKKVGVAIGADDIWKSLVVLTNPRTTLNTRYAKKEIVDKVIKADQLANYIRQSEKASKEMSLTDSEMKAVAEKWLARCKENPVDYTERFRQAVGSTKQDAGMTTESTTDQPPICQRCGVPMVKRVAKRGEHAGQEFWGCPNYPKCRNIVPIKAP